MANAASVPCTRFMSCPLARTLSSGLTLSPERSAAATSSMFRNSGMFLLLHMNVDKDPQSTGCERIQLNPNNLLTQQRVPISRQFDGPGRALRVIAFEQHHAISIRIAADDDVDDLGAFE